MKHPIKKSIITKSIKEYTIDASQIIDYKPKAGDVALFEVLEIGKHKAVQAENGTNHYIFEGDNILAVFGSRYATEQFEGYVPKGYKEQYEILGQGGIVGELKSMHTKFDEIGTTKVKLLGYAVDENNKVYNTIEHTESINPKLKSLKNDVPIYLSVGSSMDSGKTTTAAFFCRGFREMDKKIGYIKLTGSVYAKDCSFVRDCGAETAVDFSYCGYPSTFQVNVSKIKKIFNTLVERVNRKPLDAIIVEIADGLYQKETKTLLSNKNFMKHITGGVILSGGDSLAVHSSIEFLRNKNIEPIAVSGLFTASPLLIKEVKSVTKVPVYDILSFLEPKKLKKIIQ